MDIITILIMLIIGHFLVVVLTYGYFKNKSNYILKLSLTAQILFVIAYCLLLLRAWYPVVTLIITANSFLVVALAVQASAMLYAIDAWDKRIRMLYIAILSSAMTLFYIYVLLENHERIRIVMATIICAGIIAYPAWRLLLDKRSSNYRRILGAACAVSMLAFAARISSALFMDSTISFLSSSAGNSLSFMTLFALMMINGVGLLLLIKENDDQMLYAAATYDVLTGIYNRGHLIAEAEKLIELHKRKGLSLGLMVADLDHFKQVNDTYGHATGDMILKAFTQSISKNLRKYDIFGRVGGEEFVILLPDTTPENCLLIAERLVKEIESDCFEDIHITISIGLWASVLKDQDDFTNIFKAADDALYQAKNHGRNQVYPSEL